MERIKELLHTTKENYSDIPARNVTEIVVEGH